MELIQVVERVIQSADAIDHNTASPDEVEMKKALIIAASTVKSVHDEFGAPGDPIFQNLRLSIMSIAERADEANFFEQLEAARKAAEERAGDE